MKKSRLLMTIGSLLLLGLFVFPLWNITLEAPQYPIPLGMDIHINKFTDMNEFDIKNINLMNHYVGMQYIPETIPEFKIFPWAIGIMVVLGVGIGLKGNYKLFLGWFVVMSIMGIAGMYDFYLWEYDYGHNLDPNAAIVVDGMTYQPPLFGTKWLLNFKATSYPHIGGIMMGLSVIFAFVVLFIERKKAR